MPQNPYAGEIFMAGYNFVPQGYAACHGQLLSVSQNTALFSLLGTTYGGNGTSNFGLPNLQGVIPLGQGNGYNMGQTGGAASVTLTVNQLPSHSHPLNVSSTGGNNTTPVGHYLAPDALGGSAPYQTASNAVMANNAIGSVGTNASVPTISPFQVVNYYIALQGVFPTRQ